MSGTIAMTELELVMRKLANTVKLDTIEACAKILDEAAQDWRRIRDPGMANNAASYAAKIRALAVSRPERQA